MQQAAKKQASREEQMRDQHFSRVAQFVAQEYAMDVYPKPFDRVFYFNGFRIRIQAERFEKPDDTQPLGGKSEEQMADRSTHA